VAQVLGLFDPDSASKLGQHRIRTLKDDLTVRSKSFQSVQVIVETFSVDTAGIQR
jgi:hypothetical protein